MSNNDFDIITQDLEAINKVKSFEQKQKTLKNDFKKVSTDMMLMISRLESVNSEFRSLPKVFEELPESREAAEQISQEMERRKKGTSPYYRNLDDAMKLSTLNSLIIKQGWQVQDFIREVGIAQRTFYKKTETHMFSMRELNLMRELLSLTDEEFVKLFFN